MASSLALWLTGVGALLAIVLLRTAEANVVGCYFGSWSGYRQGDGRFEPEDIDACLCSHYYYGFVGIGEDGSVRILDSWNDLPDGKNFFGRFNDVKKRNPTAKTLVAIGGWNEGSSKYSAVANNPTTRARFVQNAADFVQKYGFDGFDMDWEYPADRGGAASDYVAYISLLKELREEFDKRGGLLLTAAVGVAPRYVGTTYNVPEMSKYLHYINMMTYDLHGSWETKTGHHTQLYPSSDDSTEEELMLNVNYTIRNWINNGADPKKMVLGLGTYGRTFSLANTANHGIGAPTTGPGMAGDLTREGGMLGYNEICLKVNSGWSVNWDEQIKAPYAYSGNQWVGFDDTKSAKIKAEFAKSLGLAGVFIWSIETDDFRGKCGAGRYPFLHSLNEVFPAAGSDCPATTTEGPTQPGDTTTSSTTTTTTQAPPPPQGVCKKEGYVRDPEDCLKFYYCQPNGNEYIIYSFHCNPPTVYNEDRNICDFPDNVPGCQ